MLAYVFVLLAIAFRADLLPHPAAFTPTAAALLYFGARGPRRQGWIPVALLALTDFCLTRFHYGYPYTADHLVTVAWYAGAVLMGTWLAGAVRPVRVAGAAVATSVSFFLVSNFAVWLVWNMYPKTLSGLMMSYAAGVPFFRQLGADLFFSALLFAVAAAIDARQPATGRANA